ncbi:MAG TPA: SUMF1/EgtB/PvdO family nonheme iron enzyme [Vicinamibacterales bacterium]|nr:SUMF1/EgtB/PvdO family nonheme iron enzyme [Vicinamibacterales bacterium]
MTSSPRGLWWLAGASAALVLAGALVERADLFPRLRFAIQRDGRELASSRAVDPRWVVRGQPLLSIYLPPPVLNDLLAHKMEHGRDWEREADVSYYDDGQLRFAGQAGLRVHGGGSRITSPRQSFRLFFRRKYGQTRLPPGVPFGVRIDPLRRLVVHNDVRRDRDGSMWHLVNPLAYDLARRIGAITPETEPARLLLNGDDQGLYVLTEHFDDEYFQAHLPDHRVSMRAADMERLRDQVDALRPMTLDGLRPLIDMDNLTTWFLGVLFCATRDAYQGPGQFLDESADRGGWFWVTWDLDQSFRDWDLDSFQYLLERVGEEERGRRGSEPRGVILTTLIGEDPAFRAYFEEKFDAMLNHQLTPAFVSERFAHYATVAASFDVESTAYVDRERTFFERRRGFLRGVAEQWLNTPPSVAVHVERVDGGTLTIDGFREATPYSGEYFPGRDVIVSDPDGGSLRWFVNGRFVQEGRELRMRADGPLAIAGTTRGSIETSAPPAPPPSITHGAPQPIAWARIPGGTFQMGCAPRDGTCAPNERPRARATVAPFEMMTKEVTVAQYAAYARGAGQAMPRQPHWNGDAQPVVNLTWVEARAFCASTGGRLPTEAEWEFAARGNGETVYPWGDDYRRERANIIGTTPPVDPWLHTAPVGSFPATAYGLFDMIGNVWEWTADWYREGEGWTVQPSTPPDRSSTAYLKTVRGGSWDNRRENVRISRRVGLSPDGRHNYYVGVRCAR